MRNHDLRVGTIDYAIVVSDNFLMYDSFPPHRTMLLFSGWCTQVLVRAGSAISDQPIWPHIRPDDIYDIDPGRYVGRRTDGNKLTRPERV
jgi:hypothetical protein